MYNGSSLQQPAPTALSTLSLHDALPIFVDTALRPASTSGNPRLVERLVANLVGNAIRHNVDGGTVGLSTETRDGHAVLAVSKDRKSTRLNSSHLGISYAVF